MIYFEIDIYIFTFIIHFLKCFWKFQLQNINLKEIKCQKTEIFLSSKISKYDIEVRDSKISYW